MVNGRINWTVVAVLAVVLVVETILAVLSGRLAISGHEVDVLHAADATLRLADGQRQHVDFMTPLGVLAFYPAAGFVSAGYGLGSAFIYANLVIALVMFPAVAWVSATRFAPVTGALFGAVLIVILTAMVYGGPQATVSMSMYYNRWAWAAGLLLAVVLLQPDRQRPIVDGVVLGALLGFMALVKMTFFVTLVPVAGLVLLIDRAWRTIGATAATGILIAVFATIFWGGLDFWTSYLVDLLTVSASDVRPQPGEDWTALLAAPAYLPGSLVALGAVVALRKTGRMREGLVLLLLLPAFVYITYQNWGNDPKWLIVIGFMSVVWAMSAEADARPVFLVLASAAFVLIAPSLINMSMSPLRNLMATDADYTAVLDDTRHRDLLIERKRSFAASAEVGLPEITDPAADPADSSEDTTPVVIGGVEIPACKLTGGYFGMISAVADELVEAGFAGRSVEFMDVANPLPLVGPLERPSQAAPWYYGGTLSADAAELLVVPTCPVSQVTFAVYGRDVMASGIDWTLAAELPHAWVFTRSQ